jgi:hypothetical protein
MPGRRRRVEPTPQIFGRRATIGFVASCRTGLATGERAGAAWGAPQAARPVGRRGCRDRDGQARVGTVERRDRGGGVAAASRLASSPATWSRRHGPAATREAAVPGSSTRPVDALVAAHGTRRIGRSRIGGVAEAIDARDRDGQARPIEGDGLPLRPDAPPGDAPPDQPGRRGPDVAGGRRPPRRSPLPTGARPRRPRRRVGP